MKLHAGAAETVITPPVGLPLGGWAVRAAGDNFSRFVHDDVYVRALTLSCSGRAWMFIVADVISIDSAAVDEIRRGIAAKTPLDADSIMVCANHCHSVPRLHPVALVCSRTEFLRRSVQSDGRFRDAFASDAANAGTSLDAETINADWRAEFIRRTISTGIRAWRSLRPAEVAFAEQNVPGVASSRRVRLSDGSWADPRRARAPDAVEVSRTEPDHTLRMMLARDLKSKKPLAALVNFGCHPWLFSGAGISAELPGYVCRKVAEQWSAGTEKPVVLFGTGPAGDVTAIWNIDIENLWQSRPGELVEASYQRRQGLFTHELERLGGILARGAMAAIYKADDWDGAAAVASVRRIIQLPLKSGFKIPPDMLLADWQKSAPVGIHLSELQVLRVGARAILGIPGEPFASIGRSIRRVVNHKSLLFMEQANDCGVVGYIPDRDSFPMGGYEVDIFPLAAGAGEIIVEQAVKLLDYSV